MKFDN